MTFYENLPAQGRVIITPSHGDGQETQPTQPFYGLLGVDVTDGGNRVIPDFPLTFTADGPPPSPTAPQRRPSYPHPTAPTGRLG